MNPLFKPQMKIKKSARHGVNEKNHVMSAYLTAMRLQEESTDHFISAINFSYSASLP